MKSCFFCLIWMYGTDGSYEACCCFDNNESTFFFFSIFIAASTKNQIKSIDNKQYHYNSDLSRTPVTCFHYLRIWSFLNGASIITIMKSHYYRWATAQFARQLLLSEQNKKIKNKHWYARFQHRPLFYLLFCPFSELQWFHWNVVSRSSSLLDGCVMSIIITLAHFARCRIRRSRRIFADAIIKPHACRV